MEVSVVVTTKNRTKFLERAINSITTQTKGVDEIIIVDDGSDNPEYNFLKSIGICKLILNKDSVGGAKSRNIGIKESSGKIIMFLDDDDAWLPNKVRDQLICFNENPEVSLVFSGRKVVEANNLNKTLRSITPVTGIINFERMCGINCIGTTSSVAVKKSSLDLVGGFDSELLCFQDYDLWLRLSRVIEVKYDGKLNVVYTVFNKKGAQVSRKGDGRHQITCKLLSNKYKGIMNKKQLRYCRSNLYSMTSKALSHSSPLVSVKFSLQAIYQIPSLRALKMFVGSILSVFGIKHI
jgi:glycosyltransferase involved in cell wall biosynthesis